MKPILTVIMDGFGISHQSEGNAIFKAKTPNLDKIFSTNPYTTLEASEAAVGLPNGQMGNSEVGHITIGSGRIVLQDLTFIDKSIEDGSFFKNPKFEKLFDYIIKNNSTFHILGLLSTGKIHSSLDHIYATLKLAAKYKIKNVNVHIWTDGRDCEMGLGLKYAQDVESFMKTLNIGEIKTVCGRFYSMDRDKRWDRTQLAYDTISKGDGRKFENVLDLLKSDYDAGITDEFILPAAKNDYTGIKENDVVFCLNYRSDRARQISEMFLKDSNLKNVHYVGMCQYEKNIDSIFEPRETKNTLGECLSNNGLSQLRIAETEKYAHVTFFMNAGAETPFQGEERIIVDSPKVKTYDLCPQMSAEIITNHIIDSITSEKYDVIIVNYANPDMVGHTGNFDSTVQAVEKVDECIGKITKCIASHNGVTIITADHGNAEKMLDEKNHPFTSHTCNPVPFAIVGVDCTLRNYGTLADIAPTILDIMQLEKPPEMTGETLIVNSDN